MGTPYMGWNSYDYYCTEVNEEEVLANARVMADKLKPFGWEYVVIDISWYEPKAGSRSREFQYLPFAELSMDNYGRLMPDEERFPSSKGGAGFKPLADQIHAMGLKFGIHIMRGIPRLAAHRHLPILTDGSELAGSTISPDVFNASEAADPSNICSWNPYMYGIRPNHSASQAYYDSIMQLYASWGVDYIKCDDICR
ncbi:MAG: alpha-galactosidase, partial [Firmicutes bacterium]|nr:alpha-galactosidase [Bacillota bacterium]